jgi:hypothetical protein
MEDAAAAVDHANDDVAVVGERQRALLLTRLETTSHLPFHDNARRQDEVQSTVSLAISKGSHCAVMLERSVQRKRCRGSGASVGGRVE